MAAVLLNYTTANSHAVEKSVEERLQTAEEARKAGDLTRAYRILGQLVMRAPGDERINFEYGMTCLELGDASRAEMAFQRVLQINPGNHRARLELARSMAASQRYAEARIELERVLEQNPPQRVRENIEAYLAQIRASEGRQEKPYNLQVEVGTFYDSNVNVGPDSDIIVIRPVFFGFIMVDRFEVGEKSKPKDDYGAFISGRGNRIFDIGRPGGWRADVGAFGYASLMNEENDFRMLYYQLHSGLRRRSGPHFFQAPLRFTHIMRGGESLLQSYGIASAYSYLIPQNAQRISLRADAQWRDYSNRRDRDGIYAFSGISFEQFFGKRRNVAGFGLTYYGDFPEEAIYEKRGTRLHFNGTVNLPWRSSLYTRMHYSQEDFREREVLAPLDRKDTQIQATIGARKRIGQRVILDLNHQVTDNNSTFDLYEYSRNITTLSTSYSF